MMTARFSLCRGSGMPYLFILVILYTILSKSILNVPGMFPQ